ncbi:MAG TPA: caspase family protein [Thermoanaerobaculia bacterium]|nr:caspase family protein [Thermoanaerobaculia bacterium]
MKIVWSAPGKDPKTISVGDNEADGGLRGAKAVARLPAALSTTVDLEIGKNRLEVEVLDGYHTLYRNIYTIVRRAPTEPTAVAGDKWAVILGISDYEDDRLDLQYANRDAQALRDLLLQQGGFAASRVLLLTDRKATLKEVRTALFTFLTAPKPDDLVLVFLAGHGVQDPANRDSYYFLANDSKLDNLGGTALPMWEIQSLMDSTIRAQRILVLADTCHSGAVLEKGNAASGTTLNFFNKYLENLAQRMGRLVVTASQSHESSLEKPELGHGVFTHALLEGLSGSADDNPADGVVTAGELIDYVRTNVPTETHGEQHPSFDQQGFDLNLPLAHVRQAPAKKK